MDNKPQYVIPTCAGMTEGERRDNGKQTDS